MLLQGFLIPIINTTFIELSTAAYLFLFLSSSHPKTQPLALNRKSALNRTSGKVRLSRIGRIIFPDVQPLLGPLLEW
jgi:hypothetical protein